MHDSLKDFGLDVQSDDETPATGSARNEIALEKPLVRASTALGHGVMVTPAQMLRAYGVFVDEGKRVVPSSGTRPASTIKVIAPNVATEIKKMLRENVKNGSARLTYVAGMEVGGKTSMAWIPAPRRPFGYMGGIYGYAEDANRSYALGVLVIDPKTREGRDPSFATPAIFGQVVAKMYDYGLFGKK